MKKTAGFLKFACSLTMFFEVIAGIFVAFVFGVILLIKDFSQFSDKTGGAITFSGETLTPEQLNALKPNLLVAFGFSLAAIILAFLGTSKFRKALSECKKETPFSKTSVEAIKASARYEVIGGIVGIIGGIVTYIMGSGIQINGNSIVSSMNTIHLSFLIYACQKYLLYHIAQYGHSLEKQQ
ncbi:MAG: hypothetical protein K5648_02190 [Erysipelotrichaceae bacterium]|nr:hypothetical protein [Erysipelotrichaceae bacterium]